MMPKQSSNKTLFAIAWERWDSRARMWMPGDIEYLHAESEGHARGLFHRMYPIRRTHRLVGVSIPIGMFADERDEAGRILHVE